MCCGRGFREKEGRDESNATMSHPGGTRKNGSILCGRAYVCDVPTWNLSQSRSGQSACYPNPGNPYLDLDGVLIHVILFLNFM